MSLEISLEIDGKNVKAKEGMTILQAAKTVGVEIPTLCNNEEIEPSGVCRVCIVEIERHERKRIVASCCYSVENGLKVKTKTPKLDRIRKNIVELAAVTAGEDVVGKMRVFASKYDANLSRFSSRLSTKSTKCILCGLCVRGCSEVMMDDAIGFVGRG
ncbi:MAG: 2Fe-2S iron-sulfur cluster-binding protein, partial [Candidatus Bathyarchaeota archaeon]